TRYGAGEAQVFGELGYGLTFGAIAAEPFVGLAWVHLDTASFTETGGVSALIGTGRISAIPHWAHGWRPTTSCRTAWRSSRARRSPGSMPSARWRQPPRLRSRTSSQSSSPS